MLKYNLWSYDKEMSKSVSKLCNYMSFKYKVNLLGLYYNSDSFPLLK